MPDERPILAVEGVSKRFAGTKALDGVSLKVVRGQIHALLGENGAGKSTLIKILAGVIPADAGRWRWNGEIFAGAVSSLPISFIHQDLGLVDTMSIAENIALVAGYTRGANLISWKKTEMAARRTLDLLDSNLDPRIKVGDLSAADRSIIAIGRALAINADVLVMDEPTAALPEVDVTRLLSNLRSLADRGMAIIYVTHRLAEVYRIADWITVLRDGKVVHSDAAAETPSTVLVRKIIGRALEMVPPRPNRKFTGSSSLEVVGLRTHGAGPVSFQLSAGEVLGLVGLRGAGHNSIGRTLFGDAPLVAGKVLLGGKHFDPRNAAAAFRRSVGLVPAKRREEGLAPALTVLENLYPNPGHASMKGSSFLRPATELSAAMRALARYRVRPPQPGRTVGTLSGGNQQKVVLARWLETGVRLLILEEPTAGVDVGSKAEIYLLLQNALENGMSILLVSSDFEEIVRACDRAIVFNRGKVSAEVPRDQLSILNLTSLAAGGIVRETAAGEYI